MLFLVVIILHQNQIAINFTRCFLFALIDVAIRLIDLIVLAWFFGSNPVWTQVPGGVHDFALKHLVVLRCLFLSAYEDHFLELLPEFLFPNYLVLLLVTSDFKWVLKNALWLLLAQMTRDQTLQPGVGSARRCLLDGIGILTLLLKYKCGYLSRRIDIPAGFDTFLQLTLGYHWKTNLVIALLLCWLLVKDQNSICVWIHEQVFILLRLNCWFQIDSVVVPDVV